MPVAVLLELLEFVELEPQAFFARVYGLLEPGSSGTGGDPTEQRLRALVKRVLKEEAGEEGNRESSAIS